jgi:hypothetical protein
MMFYELIYTRCRQGMDITKKGHRISGDGYKVYSCTPAIMEEGAVDLPLLANATQAKQPCIDPDFMDDAYLFYVPDTGSKFFINFHPIPFDANAQGNYSHRPGNFINHALIGNFSSIYPYKMFKNDGIWNAQTKGEEYYYENEPVGFPERSDIGNPPGHYKFDEIGAFIADGRTEALKKAVAFLIAQYKEEPEKRKYLVIRDDSSKNIELWIAAIECAFSPRIACAIPFATRMDKFVNTNRYTVKLGIYQPQMNLQDSNHKQRYRAMIVGVDERDKTNVNASRPLANSPFVLLDGKQKQAMFEADISNRYYQIITQFDEKHRVFCGEFLQTFTLLKPGEDVYNLYEIFNVVYKPSMADTRKLADALARLNKYQAANTGIYREIYGRINAEVSRFMQEDFSYALHIVNWLLKTSTIVGDSGARQNLTVIVCKAFTGIVFGKFDNTAKRSYWTQIQNTEFAQDAACDITDMNVIRDKLPTSAFTPADAATFVSIYVDCALLIGIGSIIEHKDLKFVVKYEIKVCYKDGDANSLHEIVSTLSRIKSINSLDFLFELAKDNDKRLGEFVIKYIISHDTAIYTSDDSLQSFCKKLNDAGLTHLAGIALIKRVNILNKSSEMESFIKTMCDMDFIGENVLAQVFELIDSRIIVSADTPLVELLQLKKPHGAKCINSAHLFALSILSNNHKQYNLIKTFKELKKQDFPSITDEKYIYKLVEHLIKADTNEEEQLFILDILFHAPKGYFSAYINKLVGTAAKYQDKWTMLFKYASANRNKQIDDCVIQALADYCKNEKSLATLANMVENENGFKYYNTVADKALEIISSRKGKSGLFGKLFGISGSDDGHL